MLSFWIVITLHLTTCMYLKCSFSIVIIFNCHHFATDHPHAAKTLVLSLFVQITKFQSFWSSYHPMQKASNWKSGLDMERWLTPWRTSTHERPFTQEGIGIVFIGCFNPTFWCHVLGLTFVLFLFIFGSSMFLPFLGGATLHFSIPPGGLLLGLFNPVGELQLGQMSFGPLPSLPRNPL